MLYICIISVLYCTVLYCTVLYYTVLYCTVLYCTDQVVQPVLLPEEVPLQLAPGHLSDRPNVAPGTEGLAPRAPGAGAGHLDQPAAQLPDDDDPDPPLPGRPLPQLWVQQPDHVQVEGVQRPRPVEGETAHAPLLTDQDWGLAPRPPALRPARTRHAPPQGGQGGGGATPLEKPPQSSGPPLEQGQPPCTLHARQVGTLTVSALKDGVLNGTEDPEDGIRKTVTSLRQ